MAETHKLIGETGPDVFTTIWDPGIEDELDRYLEQHGHEAGYRVLRDTWSNDYTVRTIHEIQIVDGDG